MRIYIYIHIYIYSDIYIYIYIIYIYIYIYRYIYRYIYIEEEEKGKKKKKKGGMKGEEKKRRKKKKKKKLNMKYKILKSSSGIVNPIDRIQARFSGMVGGLRETSAKCCNLTLLPPRNSIPLRTNSLIKAFVLFRERTTWMCDLCSCLRVEK